MIGQMIGAGSRSAARASKLDSAPSVSADARAGGGSAVQSDYGRNLRGARRRSQFSSTDSITALSVAGRDCRWGGSPPGIIPVT